ncbi:MAG: hypothetical protein WC807_08765 [Hyphomicrobium sp.]|jgi:hypothetical protein|uniref:hypothetical protein n=1 Tax=Hyphomicrobium sp. DMF-1 TaxID=3019544 RepID=UPI000BCB035D|nr:hypothetical protein [Hyphomicrobium sp. DMF-1]OYW53768.1 MAG: hypothetical protein B7Z29_15075 [Hyphomicrobium sp. 12-62-95]OYX98501.1 MAG: hypothetical protein B7Y80_15855 [Hyphomicrobium sp. 32-62-53]WBT38075.1 hypothetical protein PE058_20845 [Hyphomicrobium sp. DMF-1]
MDPSPFLVPPEHHKTLDFCFYKMCWEASPGQIMSQYPSLARQIDFSAISAYLTAQCPPIEYISPYFPRHRAEDLCRYKMTHGWGDRQIANAFPRTAALTDLPALRNNTLNLHRSHIRYLIALKSTLPDPASLDEQIAATGTIGKIIAANA